MNLKSTVNKWHPFALLNIATTCIAYIPEEGTDPTWIQLSWPNSPDLFKVKDCIQFLCFTPRKRCLLSTSLERKSDKSPVRFFKSPVSGTH